MSNHPTYKNMIIKTLTSLTGANTFTKFSSIIIRKTMIDTFELPNTKRTRIHFKYALNNLVEEKKLIQAKHSFRFSASYMRIRPRIVKRKVTPLKKAIKSKRAKKVAKKQLKVTKAKKTPSRKAIKPAATIALPITSTSSLFTSGSIFGSNPFNNTSLFTNTNPLFSNSVSHNNIGSSIKKQLLSKYDVNKFGTVDENKPSGKWQYFDNIKAVSNKQKSKDNWYNYDLEANNIVEAEWQKYIKNRAMNDVRAVHSGSYDYFVDFIGWKQTNIIHHDQKVRNIRRIDDHGSVTVNPYA